VDDLLRPKHAGGREDGDACHTVDVDPPACPQAKLCVVGCDSLRLDRALSEPVRDVELGPRWPGGDEQGRCVLDPLESQAVSPGIGFLRGI
jgi:hypothetical protein